MVNTLEKVEEDSRILRQFVHPMADQSNLRYSTLYTHTVWTTPLLVSSKELIDATDPSEIDRDVRNEITEGFKQLLVEQCPVTDGSNDSCIFTEPRQAIDAWKSRFAEDDANDLESMMLFVERAGENGFVLELLDALATADYSQRVPASFLLRRMAYMGMVDADELWERFAKNDEWREKVLSDFPLIGLEVIIDTVIEVSLGAGDKWRTHLPHFFALAFEGADDPDRRRYLGLAVVMSSVATDTVSGLKRLISGEQRHEFRSQVDHWWNLIEQFSHFAPAWILGRIGSTQSALGSQ